MRYGQALAALRNELRRYVWDGEFRHELGATVVDSGATGPPAQRLLTNRYSVFKADGWTPGSGDCAVVLANYGEREQLASVRVWPRGECGGGKLAACARWRLVDNATWTRCDLSAAGTLRIPPRSAAVLAPCDS